MTIVLEDTGRVDIGYQILCSSIRKNPHWYHTTGQIKNAPKPPGFGEMRAL